MESEGNGMSEQDFLKLYSSDKYFKPSVATDIVIFTVTNEETDNYRKLPNVKLRVLLIKRGIHPFMGQWALPGGFVRPNETVLQSAKRELIEETGVDCKYLEQLFTFSEPDRDPRTRVMSCAHMALIDSANLVLNGGDDASDAAWFDLSVKERGNISAIALEYGSIKLTAEIEREQIPDDSRIIKNNGIAFDHAKIILYALERLRNKLEYTSAAFYLLPEQFTLTKVQQIYEVIQNKPLLAPAFRRKIMPLVDETGEYTGEMGHRPSQLFKIKK